MTLPPLESLVRHKTVVGNVSFLLHAAIVGFAKCGTSTLSAWMESHPDLQSIPGESFALFGNEPNRLATWLWNMRRDNLVVARQNTNTTKQGRRRPPPPKQFYKQPKDGYRPQVLHNLQLHWPQAKLIYTVRHPVRWFESYWNFRYRYTERKPVIPSTVMGRKGTLRGKLLYEPLHTGLGEFHVYMAMLGKTMLHQQQPNNNNSSNNHHSRSSSHHSAEWALLKPFLKTSELNLFPFPRTNNPVFFLDAAQLSDTNTTRLVQLQHDLSQFLELDPAQPLSLPIPHIRPEVLFLNTSQLERHLDHRFDICLDQYKTLRTLLVWMGAAASQWMREYFMISPGVSYSSVDRYLEETILASWSHDPCDSET